MALTSDQAVTEAAEILRRFKVELKRIDRIDRYLRGDHDKPYTPRTANREYKLLQERSVSNWLPLVIDVKAQTLYVEGYRVSAGADVADPEAEGPWERLWQPNGMDSRQAAIYRTAFAYGMSYVKVLPGDPVPVIRGVSPRRMLAVYEDPAEDIWPVYALQVNPVGDTWKLRLYDNGDVHHLTVGATGEKPEHAGKVESHDAGVCPIVRYSDRPDLEGRCRGEIEPLIPMQDRINQTGFDLLVAQTYGSFKVRWITGMATPVGADGKAITTVEQSIRRFLTSPDKDTKFGQLDETSLSGFLESLDLSVRHMAAITQVPPHALLGQMANLSAEALAAAESGLTRQGEEFRHGFGESHEQTIRLAAHLAGDEATAKDDSGEVIWRDTEARSMAATADALGKLATMLGVPPKALWPMIPGVTQTDVARWESMVEEGGVQQLLAQLVAGQTPAALPPGPPVGG